MNNQRYPFNYEDQRPSPKPTHPSYPNYSDTGIQNLQSTYYHQNKNPRMFSEPGQISMIPFPPPPPYRYLSQQNMWNNMSDPSRMNPFPFQNMQHPTYVHPQPQPIMYQPQINDQSSRVPVIIHYHNNSSNPTHLNSPASESIFVPPMPLAFRSSSSPPTISQPINKNTAATTIKTSSMKAASSETSNQNSKPLPKWLKDEIQRMQGGKSLNSDDCDDQAILSDSNTSNLGSVLKFQTCGYDRLLDDFDEEYQPDDETKSDDDVHEHPIQALNQVSPPSLEELQKGKLLKMMTQIMLNVTTRMIAKSCQDVLQNFTKVSSITTDEEDTVEVFHSTSGLAALQDASSSDDEIPNKSLNSPECPIGRIVVSLAADYEDEGSTPTCDDKTENIIKLDNLEDPVSNKNLFKESRLSLESDRNSERSIVKLESSDRYSNCDYKKKISSQINHHRQSRSRSSKESRRKTHTSRYSHESKESHRKTRRSSRDRSSFVEK